MMYYVLFAFLLSRFKRNKSFCQCINDIECNIETTCEIIYSGYSAIMPPRDVDFRISSDLQLIYLPSSCCSSFCQTGRPGRNPDRTIRADGPDGVGRTLYASGGRTVHMRRMGAGGERLWLLARLGSNFYFTVARSSKYTEKLSHKYLLFIIIWVIRHDYSFVITRFANVLAMLCIASY